MRTWQRVALAACSLVFLLLGTFGPAYAQVQVTAANPASAPQGTVSLDVEISGSGFDGTATVQFLVSGTTNPGGITVKKVVVRGSKKLVATIDVADMAVVDKFDVQVTLGDGRKGKGTTLFAVLQKTNDPCAAAVDFPAFMFQRTSGSPTGTYLADRTGKCQRFVVGGLSTSFTRFSYPILDDYGIATNRGRIVWKGRDPANPTAGTQNMFFAMDFTVAGTNIALGAAYLVADLGNNTSSAGGSACCGIDLSVDGRSLYVPAMPVLRPAGYVHSVIRLRLPNHLPDLGTLGLPVPVTVFEHSATPTDYGQWTRDLDVNSANDLLYVGRRTDTLDGLVRVDLDPDLTDTAGNQEVTVLFNSLNGNTIIVGADVSSPASDSIAFQAYSTELNCSLLTVMNGRTGTVLNEGAAWPGTNVSWSGGKMLALGYVPVRNRSLGCRSTDVIEEVDPVTGATVPLVIGIVPDGR